MALFAHAGIALAIKPIAPKIPIWLLLSFSFALDVLSAVAIAFGADGRVGTHNPFIAAAIAIIISCITTFITRNSRFSIIAGILVFSHWVVDFMTWPITAVSENPPRMYLFPFDKSIELGLGLYRSIGGVLAGEFGFFILGMIIYLLHFKRSKSVA